MKLKVRYDESVQTIDLDAEATEQLWVSLSLEVRISRRRNGSG